MHKCHITGDKSIETDMMQAKECSLLSISLPSVWNIQPIILSQNLIWQAIVTSLFSILSLLYGIGFG